VSAFTSFFTEFCKRVHVTSQKEKGCMLTVIICNICYISNVRTVRMISLTINTKI